MPIVLRFFLHTCLIQLSNAPKTLAFKNLTGKPPKAELTNDSAQMRFYGASVGAPYQVKTSKDLVNWDTTGVTTPDPDPDGIKTSSILRGDGWGFLRLVVDEVE